MSSIDRSRSQLLSSFVVCSECLPTKRAPTPFLPSLLASFYTTIQATNTLPHPPYLSQVRHGAAAHPGVVAQVVVQVLVLVGDRKLGGDGELDALLPVVGAGLGGGQLLGLLVLKGQGIGSVGD